MRNTTRAYNSGRRGVNLHAVGTCKGISVCGMITMSKKDALWTLCQVRRASLRFDSRFTGVRK